MIRTITFSLAIFLAVALPAVAGTISISHTVVDPGVLAGYVSNDISITTTGTWTQMQLLTDGLSAGDIYQHIGGTNVPPSDLFVGLMPDLAFDSFIANGGRTADTGSAILALGATTEFGTGIRPLTFDNQLVDITWGPALGQPVTDVADWLAARITLKDTANGTFQLLWTDSEGGKALQTSPGTIVNGGMTLVPEPSTFLLLAVGSLGLLFLRRRRNG